MKKILIILIILLFNTSSAGAAIVSVSNQSGAQILGEKIEVDIFLNTEGKNINSVEMTVVFPSDILTFEGYSNKESSIPIWISDPKLAKKGEVYLSGIIPGGIERLYDPQNQNNRDIKLVKLFFKASLVGSGEIRLKDVSVLRNDGKGTREQVSTIPAVISIQSSTKTAVPDDIAEVVSDTTAPERFKISILPSSVFARSPRLAIFNTSDDQGGIEYYEVKIGYGKFVKTESPHPLPYRIFDFDLSVRAYDYSGNFTQEDIVVPGESSKGLMKYIGLVLIAVVFYRYRIYRRKKTKDEILKDNN